MQPVIRSNVHAFGRDASGNLTSITHAQVRAYANQTGRPPVLGKDMTLQIVAQSLADHQLQVGDILAVAFEVIAAHKEALRAMKDQAVASERLRQGEGDAVALRAEILAAQRRMAGHPQEVRNILRLLRTSPDASLTIFTLTEQHMAAELGFTGVSAPKAPRASITSAVES